MASTLQKLLRRSQPTRLITASRDFTAPTLTPPLIFHQPHLNQTKPDPHQILNPSPLLVIPKTENLTSHRFSQIFPSFPFAICLNPIPSSGLVSSEDVELDDSRKVWADSVKKKRKRKMNKHKYRKLRKRLSRQT